MAQKTVRKKIAKGKTWFKVHAPKIFNENEIGEILGWDSSALVGRIIDTHFSQVSGDMTRHYIKLKLRIKDVTGEHASTEIIGYEVSKPSLQRIIRRRASKIDFVKDIKLKDGKKMRVKCLAITFRKADADQRTKLRNMLGKEIEKVISAFDLDTLVVALSTSKPQKEMMGRLKKIYPLRFLEINKIEFTKKKAKKEKKPKEEKTEETALKEAAAPEEAPESEAKPKAKEEKPKAKSRKKAEESKETEKTD